MHNSVKKICEYADTEDSGIYLAADIYGLSRRFSWQEKSISPLVWKGHWRQLGRLSFSISKCT
jgi:hypothetical protein